MKKAASGQLGANSVIYIKGAWLLCGRIDLKPMISQVFSCEQLPDALRADQQKSDNMKIQVEW